MLRDILSGSRAILVGLVFFVLIVGGSLLYSWHVHRITDAEMAQTQRKVQPLEIKNKTRPLLDVSVPTEIKPLGASENSVETEMPATTPEDTEVLPNETEMLDLSNVFLPDDFVLEEGQVDGPVSPYGFGPYPPLPEGISPDILPAPSARHELMLRVRIKLLSQGVNAEGISERDNGLFYPIIKGTLYVQWDDTLSSDGYKYVKNSTGHPVDGLRLRELSLEKGPLTEVDIPSDIKVVPYEEAGIDPYEFLDLQR